MEFAPTDWDPKGYRLGWRGGNRGIRSRLLPCCSLRSQTSPTTYSTEGYHRPLSTKSRQTLVYFMRWNHDYGTIDWLRGCVVQGRRFRWWLLVIAVLVLVSCGGGDEDGTGSDSGLPNPASVFCEAQGGSVEIVTDAAGNQSGICNLPDGTEIEEWQYYRQSSGEDSGAGLANPAAVFCEEQGGIVSGPEPMCELPDGTVVDAWEYFREQADPGR